MRNFAWIAVCGMMVSGVLVTAQQPMPMQNPLPYGNPGNPGAYGYPGYPPYGPPLPMGPQGQQAMPMPFPQPMPYGQQPYGQPMPMPYGQQMPYGQPMPMPYRQQMPMAAPPDPRLAPGQKPSLLPSYNGVVAPKDATEPYFVLPDSPSSRPLPAPLEAKPATPGSVITEPFARLVQFVTDPSPSEPYTTYEGRPYAAEQRLDNSRMWAQANFIHWWVRRDNTPPLVTTTTGDPNAAGSGSIGTDGTVILLGNSSIAPKEFSGIQATIGLWLDPERLHSLEIGGFWLGRSTRQYSFTSDANGNPLIAQPFINQGAEGALSVTFPDSQAGSIAVNSAMNFHSLELNSVRNILRLNGWSLDSLVGIRYLYLNDTLSIDQNFTMLPNAAFMVPFNGVPEPNGSNFVLNDSFNVTNRFYGGQIGARLDWACNRLDLGAVLKVGFGATTHVAVVNGTSTLNAIDGSTTTVPGGSLAQPSNIGRFTSTDFSVVPELTLTAGYQVTCNLRVLVGYTAIEWTRIERAGDQIDRRIDLTQVPTATATPGTVGTTPIFPGSRSNFWAQGINVGIELKY